MLGTNIFMFLKLYSGYKWLRKRDRNSFIGYYRQGMTFILTMIMWMPLSTLLLFSSNFSPILIPALMLVVAFYATQLVCLELHMRYIDQIHFAKNNLARDRQLLQRYKSHLELM